MKTRRHEMKSLIICEKPNLAKNVIAGINENFNMKDGYGESDSYIVSWAFGHLFELFSVEQYRPDYNPKEKYPWKLDSLPFYPEEFKFNLKKNPGSKTTDLGVKNQFNTIKKLIEREDVNKIYNCGDADREGEIIVRLILQAANNKKPVLRVWTDDQSPQTLWKAVKNAKADTEYDNLANEGMARTYVDWLYGINLTRLISIKAGTLERIGRCVTVIVDEIYKRDMEIENFKPVPYFAIISDKNNIILTNEKKFSTSEEVYAVSLCNKLNNETTRVTDKKTERKTLKAPKPFSLTKLQNYMGKKHKYPPDNTLSTLQSLYEAGFVSYPRTSSEYYATGEKDKVSEILKDLKENGHKVSLKDNWFNDKYVESHGALRISKLASKEQLAKFTADEKVLYEIILNHMLADFCDEDLLIDHTKIIISIGELDNYVLEGNITVQKGWSIYEEPSKKDKELPALNVGDIIETDFKPVEKKTIPPKHYTIATLNNLLENPFRKISNEDEGIESTSEDFDDEFKAISQGLSIGTSATRAGIIKNAIVNQYIKLDKGSYYIMPNGRYMIETLKKLNIDMDKFKTVDIGKILKQISNGNASPDDAIKLAKKQIDTYFNNSKDITLEKASKSEREVIGMCPKCGQPVYEGAKNYYCSNKECDFALFKENKWWQNKKKNFTKTIAKGLLKDGRVKVKGFYSEKTGKNYDATVVMDLSGKYVNFKMEF